MTVVAKLSEDDLIKGAYDSLEKVEVDISYVKKILLEKRRAVAKNELFRVQLAEVTEERDVLLKALGAKVKNHGRATRCDDLVRFSMFMAGESA